MMIHEFSQWLGATQASEEIRALWWLVPAIQTVHILALAVVIASAVLIDARLLGLTRNAPVAAYVRRYVPWMGFAVLVLLFSGVTLIVGEPGRTLENWVFWTKMALVAAGACLTLILAMAVRRDEAAWDEGSARVIGKLLATLGLLVWIAVVVCGRWIAYVL